MRILFTLLILITSFKMLAQSAPLIEEARSLERQFKTDDAIHKYLEYLVTDPKNKMVLLRIVELYCMKGNETESESDRLKLYQSATKTAHDLWQLDSTSADAHYARALVMGRMISFASVKEKAQMTKSIKDEVDKALKIDPSHLKSLYTLAKWHDEVSSLNPAVKAAMKVFFGNLPPASIEEALLLYKRVREINPSFIGNNLDYALALKKMGRSDLAIEVLTAQLKYPVKTKEDQILKEKSKQLLSSLQ
jgi:tetratricopeptide (TPR) repeat protein